METTHWYDRLWASLIFFTRLPFWRLHQPPRASYAAVVEHWPLVGWLTGGAMAATIYLGCLFFPYHIALLLAIAVRVLLTGALHEDGLADFIDGFGGGGNDRQRILAIMKDSHIGTYGVVGLVFYFALLYGTLLSLDPVFACFAVMAGDAYSKMLSAQIVMFLPYARSSETSKNGVVYRRMSVAAGISLFVQGALPMALFYYLSRGMVSMRWDLLIFVPCIAMYFLYYLMLRKLKGYTGDCCGATFLLCELSFYIGSLMLINING